MVTHIRWTTWEAPGPGRFSAGNLPHWLPVTPPSVKNLTQHPSQAFKKDPLESVQSPGCEGGQEWYLCPSPSALHWPPR